MPVVQVVFAWVWELAEDFAVHVDLFAVCGFLFVVAQHGDMTEDTADYQLVEAHLKKTDASRVQMDHLNRIVWNIHFETHPLINC